MSVNNPQMKSHVGILRIYRRTPSFNASKTVTDGIFQQLCTVMRMNDFGFIIGGDFAKNGKALFVRKHAFPQNSVGQ